MLNQQDDEYQGSEKDLIAMLRHRPDVLRALSAFGRAVVAAPTSPSLIKELAILRTSILNGCAP